jgi:hypothetical protein
MHRKITNYRASRSSQEYTGTFYISYTPSYDLETEIDQTFPVAHITEALIHETVKQFFREIDQAPIFRRLRKMAFACMSMPELEKALKLRAENNDS